MADYISREAAIEVLHYNSDESCASVVSDFEAIPAADVEPVRHGRWEDTNAYFGVTFGRCSACGLFSGAWHINQPYRFCPHCGAKMDLEGKNE